MNKKLKVGFFFGGRSTEHEVSVITALQAFENLDQKKYQVVPVYVSKAGEFYTNPDFLNLKSYQNLPSLFSSSNKITLGQKEGRSGFWITNFLPTFTALDLAFPFFHGSFGENGSMQGLFEIYNLPYVGFGVMGSSVGMDKVIQKRIYQALGLNIGKFISIKRSEFMEKPKETLAKIQKSLKFPMFIKPNTAGSSIGGNLAKNEDELSFNIEVAATYAEVVLIEETFQGLIEVNCSVLGYQDQVETSVCEMPVASGESLTFYDKYQKGGSKGNKSPSTGSGRGAGMASLSRVIPAPISPKLTKEIEETSRVIFQALDGCGVARIDYFIDQGKSKVWVNEINTIPGSLSYYLWEPKGLSYQNLLDKLINLALLRAEEQKKTQYVFESGLLEQMAQKVGIKR